MVGWVLGDLGLPTSILAGGQWGHGTPRAPAALASWLRGQATSGTTSNLRTLETWLGVIEKRRCLRNTKALGSTSSHGEEEERKGS